MSLMSRVWVETSKSNFQNLIGTVVVAPLVGYYTLCTFILPLIVLTKNKLLVIVSILSKSLSSFSPPSLLLLLTSTLLVIARIVRRL